MLALELARINIIILYYIKILHFLPVWLTVYIALISSHHFSNDYDIEKFKNIAIYSNYVFLVILASSATGEPLGDTKKLSAGHRLPQWHFTC